MPPTPANQSSGQGSRADEHASQDQVTAVSALRDRVFLHQSIRERVAGAVWTIVWSTLFRWSPPFMRVWRNLLLRLFGARIGQGTFVASSARILFPWNLIIEKDVLISHGVIINCMGTVKIAAGTHISQYAHICAGTHEYTSRRMPIVRSPISIGERCWIAADAFVGPNVTIGDNSVLAARSSAFGSLPSGSVCVGEPARPLKPRDH